MALAIALPCLAQGCDVRLLAVAVDPIEVLLPAVGLAGLAFLVLRHR